MIRIGLLRRDGFEFGSKVPGQEIGDATDRVLGDALQRHAQVGLRIDAVQLGCADQTVDSRGPFATRIGRQFIVPGFWPKKSQLTTPFIRFTARVLSLWASTSTTVPLMCFSADPTKRDICFRRG